MIEQILSAVRNSLVECAELRNEIAKLRESIGNLATKTDLQNMTKTMATKQDLDNAIAALPEAIETAVESALAPVIAALQAKAGTVDLQSEIDQLNAVAGTVSTKVAADLTPAS